MSTIVNIAAEKREKPGKGASRSLRRQGKVPGVIYGDKKDPLLIALTPKALIAELNKPGFFTHVFSIDIDGAKHQVIAKDVQFEPVTDFPIHCDFMRVNEKTRLHINVPVHFHNREKSPGLKRGGVLNIVSHTIEVYCTIQSMIESIDIDLSGLNIGDSIHVDQVQLPTGVSFVSTDRDFTIATIVAPSGLKSEDDEGAAAPAGETAATTS